LSREGLLATRARGPGARTPGLSTTSLSIPPRGRKGAVINNKLIQRFAALYAGLTLIVGLAGFAAYKAYTIPSVPQPKTVVHKQDLGNSNVVEIAEQTVESQATQAGVVVRKMTAADVHTTPTGATVDLVVDAVDPISGQAQRLKLRVTLTKGLYSVSNVVRTG